MGVILRPTRTHQPPLGTGRIDWSNPLARGLVFALVPTVGGYADLVSGQHAQWGAASSAQNLVPAAVAYAGGSSLLSSNAGGNRAARFANRTGADEITGSFSIFVEGRHSAQSVGGAIVWQSGESGSGDGIGIAVDDGSNQQEGFAVRGNNSEVTGDNWAALGPSGTGHFHAHRFMGTGDGTNIVRYAQGSVWESRASTFLPNANSARRVTVHGNWATDPTAAGGRCDISVSFAWNRVLGLGDYLQLYKNPWQLFAPISRKLYFDVGVTPTSDPSRRRMLLLGAG